MQIITQVLEIAFRRAFLKAGIASNIPILLVDASRPEFGDFQVNGIMAAAKQLRLNPRELASQVIALVDLSQIVAKLEIAGPGFINITLSSQFLATYLANLTPANKFSVQLEKQTIVVDLSSPNLAKEMHVGHLRSTVIGDAIARIFEYLGNKVIRQNHVGDWGTQFGMLIANLFSLGDKQISHIELNDLEKFYRQAKERFDSDSEFANQARNIVVTLQNNSGVDAVKVRKYWQEFNQISLSHCQHIYNKLNVNLSLADVRGESSYNAELQNIVARLQTRKLLATSDGAECVFFASGELPGGEETPFIVQKKDGGFLYSTTDLAAIDYRVHTLHADKIIYVVDARQSFHFKQLFLVSKKAGFAKSDTILVHSAFGTMMNEDGRPFKTRDGGTVKLIDLIDEAIGRAYNIVSERNPHWNEMDKTQLAQILAIGAIKYADLSKNRTSDYIFSFDKMLAFDGNTAPYLLYAYTRIRSILRKSELEFNDAYISLLHASEHKLGLHLAKFNMVLLEAANECLPHYLCQYLYNLAGLFMQFYESCPILKTEDVNLRKSRLSLAVKTGQILKTGLDLLGIQVVERM